MPDSPSTKRSPSKGSSASADAAATAASTTAESEAVEAKAVDAQAAAAEGEPDSSAGAGEDGPVTSSAKEIFAAALEKKKSAGQSRSAHLDGHGGVGGATASHKATRTFRRKSG